MKLISYTRSKEGAVIHAVAYNSSWYQNAVKINGGWTLEMIDTKNPCSGSTNWPTQDADNWHSASTSAGYGTPGYQNSQFKADAQLQGSIAVSPAVFSPDNDGFNDFITINYEFTEPGYVCNISIFDANGRIVRSVTHNALCGLQGYFRWDGLDGKSAKLPIGVYVIYTDVFNLKGKTNHYKQAVTLARRLN